MNDVCTYLFPVTMPPRTSRHLTESELNRLLILYGAGNSNRSIARQLGCSEGSVRNALSRYHRTGSTRQATSPGRPHKLSAEREEQLCQLCRRRPKATSYAISFTARLMGIGRVSERYVRDFRRRLGFRPFTSQPEIPLTDRHKRLRLAYCQRHQHSRFRHTLFSDKSVFRLDYTRVTYWLQPDQPCPTHPAYVNPIKVMVWGAVSWNTRSRLYFKPPGVRINAQRYTRILSSYVLPMIRADPSLHLLQDNAPPHAAAHTTVWLLRHRVHWYFPYPPKSPDLNAIEKVWSWMKRYVRSRGAPNAMQLKQRVQQAWDEIPQAIIRSYIIHTVHQVQRVIAANGDHPS